MGKVIAIAAVTAGGKTTTVNEIKKQLPNVQTLHFDDYEFEGEVDNFYQWVLDGADYNVWNLEPLEKDILNIQNNETCDYLILDYPFAYCNEQIRKYIDVAVFIDTPLDIALARRILRDMSNASGKDIRDELMGYLKYARVAFVQMQKDILPSSDYVIDGTMSTESIVERIINIMIQEEAIHKNHIEYMWTDGTNEDFQRFYQITENYYNKIAGGEENRKTFIPYNISDSIQNVLIAYRNGIAIGCAGLKRYSETEVEMKRVWVEPEYRKRNIATDMMNQLETLAKKQGFHRMILQTREIMSDAVGLYKKLGYCQIQNYPPYDEMHGAICFAKNLNA